MVKLKVEIAKTQHQLEEGLMFRKHLPEDNGMLFIFREAQELRFWGMNTYIPLDIAFIDEDNKIVKIGKVKVLSQKTVSSDDDCLMAVEANEGWFAENGVKEGYSMKIDKSDDGDVVIFDKAK